MVKHEKVIKRLLGMICLLLIGTSAYLAYASTRLTNQIESSKEQFDELQAAITTPVVAQNPPTAPRGVLAVMKQIELEAKRADLDELLTRMEQQSGNEIKLLFESVSFNTLMAWFDQVYQSTGLQPRRVMISRRPTDNRVTAQAIYR